MRSTKTGDGVIRSMAAHSPEFIALLNKLLNETISPAEHVQLNEHLRGNPDAINEYLLYVDLHTGFKELEGRSEEELCLSRAASSERPVTTSADDPNRPLMLQTMRKPGWIHAASIGIAVASTLLLISVFLWRSPAPAPVPAPAAELLSDAAQSLLPAASPPKALAENPAVRLSQAAHAELFLEQIPNIGSAIQLGHEYVLSKGLMELAFENGATAVIASPAIFTVASSMRIEMKIGRCSVHAPDSAHGFEVVTPQGRVLDLGTRFSVVADDTGVSDVQVLEGAVEYHPPSRDAASSMLLEGEAVRLPSKASKTKAIPFNPAEYQAAFPDRMISYQAAPSPKGDGVRDLISVTLQRGNVVQTFPVQELIGVDVLHFSADGKRNSACSAEPLPVRVDRVLTESIALNEGLTNFDCARGPYRPPDRFKDFQKRHGLAVQFRQPLKNAPGPDVVLFELQSAAYPPEGDPFYISPIEDLPGLKTHHVRRFDITMYSKDALQVAPLYTYTFDKAPQSLEQLLEAKVVSANRLHVPFYALAVGVDLSDLGYPEDASVSGLFLEDADNSDDIAIDLVFIGGLP